jgi:hypothetical protein
MNTVNVKQMVLFFCVGLVTLSFSGCKSSDRHCKNAMCTMVFVSITAEITSDDFPASAISTVTVRSKSDAIVHMQEARDDANGVFEVVNDSHLSLIGYNKNERFFLQVYVYGKLHSVFDYNIFTDCCHVNLESGPHSIRLFE